MIPAGHTPSSPPWSQEPGRTSSTSVLDAVRLRPGDDEIEVTAVQVRQVIARLIAAGHWQAGDLDMLIVFDAGYEVTRWPGSLLTCPWNCSGGCARTGCSTSRRRPGPTAAAARSGMARSSRWRTRRPGPARRSAPAPRRRGTAPLLSLREPAAPAAHLPRRPAGSQRRAARDRGHTDPAGHRSPARRHQAPAGMAVVLAASTWNTPSGCSGRSSGGLSPRSATLPPRTGGGPG